MAYHIRRALQDSANGTAAKYKVDAPTITQLDEGRQWVNWTLDNLPESRNSATGFTEFKNNLLTGSVTDPINEPVPPPFTKKPGVTLTAGVITLATSVAGQIKGAVNYDPADGAVLGIEGAIQLVPEAGTTVPEISARPASGGNVEIVWSKGDFGGIKIEVDRGDGWKFLAVDTQPNYIDTFKPASGQSAVYKYRAIYLLDDAEFGQWSNIAEVAAKG